MVTAPSFCQVLLYSFVHRAGRCDHAQPAGVAPQRPVRGTEESRKGRLVQSSGETLLEKDRNIQRGKCSGQNGSLIRDRHLSPNRVTFLRSLAGDNDLYERPVARTAAQADEYENQAREQQGS